VPEVASATDGSLVVWRQTTSTTEEIWAARVATEGAPTPCASCAQLPDVLYGKALGSAFPSTAGPGAPADQGGRIVVTFEELALAASAVFAGLWSGLLGMLTLVMHRMLAAMDGQDFERFLRAFLPVGRKAWFNYVCAIGMAVAPIVALVALWDDPSSASFVLTAIGLAIVLLGVYVVSNVWKEPLYDVMLAWDPDAMPGDWQAGRGRYFTINWIQLAATWTVFGLFLVALILL
jgi:hypothetical protein